MNEYRHIQIEGISVCCYDFEELAKKGVGHIRCGSIDKNKSIADALTLSKALGKDAVSVKGHCEQDNY